MKEFRGDDDLKESQWPNIYKHTVRSLYELMRIRPIRPIPDIEKDQRDHIDRLLMRLGNSVYRKGSTRASTFFLLWLRHFKDHARYEEVLAMLVEIGSNQESFDRIN